MNASDLVLPDFRKFGPATQAVADDWSTKACGTDTWTPTSDTWATNTKPIGVENQNGLRGVQKPGNDAQPHIDIAANEKIAADLAALLGLPVPPVILHDHGQGAQAPRFVAISAWARAGVLQWGIGEAGLTPEQRMALRGMASAMLPFEAWIGAQDRQNWGNVLVAAENDGSVFGYWIDYSWSLNFSWQGNVHPHCHIQGLYPPLGEIDLNVVLQVASAIAVVSDGVIEGIVNRIPSECLAPASARVIIDNLKCRRASLAALSNMGVA